HTGEVGRHPRPADQGRVAVLTRSPGEGRDLIGVAVGGEDPLVHLHSEAAQHLACRLHAFGVARGPHEHGDLHATSRALAASAMSLRYWIPGHRSRPTAS